MATPKFRPYRGLDEKIKSMPQQPGYVYFATDTGRIYLDYNDQRIPMGGNGASLYYANDTDVVKDLLDYYYIDIDTIVDAGSSLKANDLIINGDGAFYRVLEVTDENTAKCTRIAVSGTGGGGSGDSGGGTGPSQKNITLELVGEFPTTFVYGKKTEVTFKSEALYDTYIRYNIVIQGNNETKTLNYQALSGDEFTFDVGSELYQGNNIIVVTAFADNSGEATLKYPYRESIVFALKKNPEFNPKVVQTGTLRFYCIPVGTTSKTLEIYIDNVLAKTETIGASLSDSNYTVDIEAQTHGTHTIQAILKANVGGASVETDPISYQVAWNDGEDTAPLVWFPEGYPNSIVQYEDLLIEFMVWHPEKTTEIETHFYKSGIELASSPRLLNYNYASIQKWNITDYEVGSNSYTIRVGGTSQTINVEVEPDENRDLDIRTGGLILNLETSGRSNEENISSRTSWISKNTDIPTAVTFNNFNWYNNGWIEDDDGRSCLRISNGASISIPVGELDVLNSESMAEALTLEFRFKARNIQEYATLITTTSTEDEDGKVTVIKNVSTDKGVIGQLYGNGLGFCIGTQEAFLKSSNTIVNARYREDEIINLTFVIEASSNMSLLYIYLQGILSGIAKYGSTDKFNSGAQNITFNSDYCDIDLYNIRIYRGAKLESSDVVHNYISDLKDVKSYDANQIVTTVNSIPTIDYNKMLQYNANHPDETIIPYMIIESRDSDNKLPYIKGGKKPVNIEFHNPALDYAYNMGYITGEQYLHGAPSFTYTSAKKSLDVQGTSSQGYPRRNYKWKAKQEDAKWRYLAGPLQGYPIYEYNAEKDKYIGQDYEDKTYKKFYLDSDIGETTFCFKADYMESSSTHNTGYASYVSTLYSKHPLKDYYPGVTLPDSIRTTVYGFPMIVFQKTGANTYEFVGRYNFNLDKGATDSCGFTYEGDSYVRGEDGNFLPMEEVAECWEICNNQGQRTSFVKVDFEETTDAYDEIEMTIDKFEANKYYIVTNINTSTGEHTYELATEYDANKVYYTKQSGILSVLDDFEYRYSFYEDEIDHAIDGADEFAGIEQSVRNEAILYRMRNLKDMALWLQSTDVSVTQKLGTLFGTYTEVTLTEDTFVPTTHFEYDSQYKVWRATTEDSVFDATKKYATCEPQPVTLKDGNTYKYDDQEYRLAKFLAEFSDHFDQEYCEVYFIMTELLHLYDSRGKNCMMATWGPKVEGGNYIWYPIFYDIDTQLGINNSGVPTWDYYVNPTEENMFSTSNGVLWNNMWAVFKQSIQNRYVDLRKNQLNIDAMDGYYNSHPILGRGDLDSWREINLDEEGMSQLVPKINSFAKIGKKPVMIYNVDQYYKYIGPAVGGYINTSGGTSYTDTFFYCLQGSRELMRYLYLRNRLNFVDSKWHGDAYSIEGALGHLKMRYDANLLNSTSDSFLYTNDPAKHGTVENKYTDQGELIGTYTLWNWDTYGPNPLDCLTDFQGVRSFLRQYMSLQTDSSVYDPVPCDGYEAVTLNVSADIQSSIKLQPALTQQLVYLGGGEYIADLGDLGTKYLDEFVATTLKRLMSLRLGSDVPGYFNNQLNSKNCQIGANAYNLDGSRNTEAKTLLKEIVLTGLTGLDGELDVSGSEKLKSLRALRTILTSVVLADGVQIETLHLPNTITNISLIEPVALQGILTSETVTPEDKGLFIEGITNSNGDYSKDIAVNTYAVTGGKLGYDSYKLLDILVNFKKAIIERNEAESSKTLSINLREVNWSPYSLVEYGEPYYTENANLYFYDNQRFGLEPYTTYEAESWKFYTQNERMYLLDESYFESNQNVLVDLNIFDTFIETYEIALQDYEASKSTAKNYFKSATSTQKISIPEVTGLMYVNNTDAIDEAQVANHYLNYFPKMKFFFKNVQKAYTATYVTSIDGVEEVIYTERKSADSTDLTLTYPPLPTYEPVRLNYDFVGWSLDKNATPGASGVYHPEYTADFETEWAKLAYTSTDTPMRFYAIFDSTKFAVYFKNYFKDGTIVDILDPPLYVTAGEYLYEPDVLPSTDESALPDDQRYKLLGWVTDTKYCFPESEAEGKKHIVDLTSIRSENVDRTFYACYIQESVFDSVTNPDLFSYSYETYSESEDPSQNISGYTIQPKGMLNGKITIPGTYNGSPVIALIGTNGQSGLTHIYFEKPENIRWLSGIYSNSSLRYFDFPSGTRRIMPECFQYNTKLKFPTKLATSNVVYIGSYVFRGSFSEEDGQIELIQLPSSLKTLDQYAFSNIHTIPNLMPNGHYRVLEVAFGGPGDPSNFDIGSISSGANVFRQSQLWGSDLPTDANASAYTPIKKFTFYRETGSTVPSETEFDEFVKSDKIVGAGFSVVETAVVDTTRG